MYPRTDYEMSEEALAIIIKASRPVPVMMIGYHTPDSPQERANRAWKELGNKMGFDPMSVRPPTAGKGQLFFSAIPAETEGARKERMEREAEQKRENEIQRLEGEIAERQQQLLKL
jgi:hypothetical protein